MIEQQVEGLNFKGIKNLFNLTHTKSAILKAESEGRIPEAHRLPVGENGRVQRIWDYSQISRIGELYGFLKKPSRPYVIANFSTKGGILKSTIALNIARTHALHNIKTIVIDLDPQGDSSRNLGLDISEESVDSLEEANEILGGINGLFDLKQGSAKLTDLIQDTDIPTLQFIPATSELIALMDLLNSEVRREYWLKDFVVRPLQQMGYELVIIDLAPSWSIYTSNALTAADLLISPLETKIAHWRNHQAFIQQLEKFIDKMKLKEQLDKIFIPVKTSGTRKLSTQIKQYYHNNVKNCSPCSIRESIVGEEAVAKRLSVIEYANNNTLSEDFREFLIELNSKISKPQANKVSQ